MVSFTKKKRRFAKGSPIDVAGKNAREINEASQLGANLRIRQVAVVIGFGVIGWALCGGVVLIGGQFVSMNTTLIVHAAAVPLIFGSLSLIYSRNFGVTSPLQTAIVFLGVVVLLDVLIVALLIEGSFEMFRSILGTWVPFALILLATYICGAFATAGRATDDSGMIEAVAATKRIRRVYDLLSFGYGAIVSPLENRMRMLGLERAAIQPDDDVLEVAVGPGHSFVEILKRVNPTKTVCGVDVSPKMIDKTRRRFAAAGLTNAVLREADARQLPFPDDSFDVLYNSYMLDLIPLGDMRVVLEEFLRVLKPEGRLVLINMSKQNAQQRIWLERLYQSLPKVAAAYLLGGCRPVLMEQPVKAAGFLDVRREFIPHGLLPSEIVTAIKPFT